MWSISHLVAGRWQVGWVVVDEDGVAGVAGVEACFAAHVDGDVVGVEDDAADFAEEGLVEHVGCSWAIGATPWGSGPAPSCWSGAHRPVPTSPLRTSGSPSRRNLAP